MRPEPELLLATSRFNVVRHRQKLADGTIHTRETVAHPGAVVILPMLADDRICLIRNYRIAVDEELIELPAGTMSPGEDPLETARRELTEETGYRAATLKKLCEFWVSPGILSERMHLYLAEGLDQGETALEAGEQIQTYPVAWSEALALVDQGRIRDAKTLAGLLFLERLRQRAK